MRLPDVTGPIERANKRYPTLYRNLTIRISKKNVGFYHGRRLRRDGAPGKPLLPNPISSSPPSRRGFVLVNIAGYKGQIPINRRLGEV